MQGSARKDVVFGAAGVYPCDRARAKMEILVKRFDPSKKDSLDQWSRERAKLVARSASEIHTIDLPREDRITQEAKAYEDIEFSNRKDPELNREALRELG